MKQCDFTGLDGGREGLWQPGKWLTTLIILNQHENSDIYDSSNSLYQELGELLPNEKWASVDQGNFRPLFRDYSHPWTRTGVISIRDGHIFLTELGKLLISKRVSYEYVLDQLFNTFTTNEELPFKSLLKYFDDNTGKAIKTNAIANYFGIEGNSKIRRLKLAIRLLEHAGKLFSIDNDHWISFKKNATDDHQVKGELKDIIKSFQESSYITGLQIEKLAPDDSPSQICKLLTSLLTKPFLILTGLSGSGKTKLAQAFAQWITPKPDEGKPNPHIALIPVGADWMGNENILGYPNGLDAETYVSTPALELILHAREEANKDIPHFLILDEMNLSHVERYFADFLSAIESGEEIPLYEGEQRTAGESDVPQKLKLPKNLFVVGTVNVDETTYMFSPKVLDRANVIEFRMEPTELKNFLANPVKPDLDKLAGEGHSYAAAFIKEASDSTKKIRDSVKDKFETEMELFFDALAKEGAEFGYRTAYEASRFLYFYEELRETQDGETDGEWFNTAFDAVIVQKFLPKLHGSSSKLSELLHELWNLCITSPSGKKENADTLEISLEQAKIARFPMSAAKIARMIKVLERNGFVSFAEA